MNYRSFGLRQFLMVLVPVMIFGSNSVEATWSVIIGDRTTGELAAGSVTCLNGDLLAVTPMVLTGIGIGIVQGNGDPRGIIRPAMREAFLNDASAQEVLDAVMGFGGGNRRQYGICSTESCVSWTGSGTGDWSGGTAGQNGNIFYAIQGNVLAGDCVVGGMFDAIADNAQEDIPNILMAAMEAAHFMGGDGRCSCSARRTDCGCPVVPEPDRTGIIGYMLVARAGDFDDQICDEGGCADGDYFMKINVTGDAAGPDAVPVMRQMFLNWRNELIGHPDAVRSEVTIAPNGNDYVMTVQVKDWQGELLVDGPLEVAVSHTAASAEISVIGPVEEISPGIFGVPLTVSSGESSGPDVFRITVMGLSTVVLMPNVQLLIGVDDYDEDGYFREPVGTDCDDSNALVNPGAVEVCDDGIDNDCNGLSDAADLYCGSPPECSGKNESCSQNEDCCSGKCNQKNGKCTGGATSATTNSLWKDDEIDVNAACPQLGR